MIKIGIHKGNILFALIITLGRSYLLCRLVELEGNLDTIKSSLQTYLQMGKLRARKVKCLTHTHTTKFSRYPYICLNSNRAINIEII